LTDIFDATLWRSALRAWWSADAMAYPTAAHDSRRLRAGGQPTGV